MWVQLNDRLLPEDEARISVFDRGFMYGDGVFETMRAVEGRIFRRDLHLARLSASAAAVRIPMPRSIELIRADIRNVLDRNGAADAVVRISLSRGVGDRGPALPEAVRPTYVVAALPPPRDLEGRGRQGVRLAISTVRKTPLDVLPSGVKHANYLNSILAHAEAAGAGADDALMLAQDGVLAECATSNIFVVFGACLRTPPADVGILPGITRGAVLEMARAGGVDAREERLAPESLEDAEEVFVTNSVVGLMPVRAIGKHVYPAPGALTVRLQEMYRRAAESEST